MRKSVLLIPVALVLLTGVAWGKDLTVSATRSGVNKLCGGNDSCTNVQCGSTTCDGSCSATGKSCVITIHRTVGKPPRHAGGGGTVNR